ncbi:hypothetical protein DN752_20885 [Echinicola strongylocentroti]|uniref:DUF3302 domain-containing protein n=1 Tax=Echinicola strongylocentroti TaxID=1795355 RepID=A0A2Z4IP44_9BACT|nr:DUF3302 domain-containing protein [Echinicola strongylocentroti]AWW32398.1 hypothetical protein DN752_20885 [Echinicola strongylocentroti]
MKITPKKSRWILSLVLALYWPLLAQAQTFEDKIADVISWVALIVAPIVGIGAFLMVHVLPEKIAEKRQHPQAQAIKTLCILSLFFGGVLWPLAWLWAYSMPVFYKMAYGTDKGDYHEETLKEFNQSKNKDQGKP